MGICWECRVEIDGAPHRRACMELVRDGMVVSTEGSAISGPPSAVRFEREALDCDVAVVGAGPAGVAAACRAAESGARTLLLDDAAAPGGQIHRRLPGRPPPEAARAWLERLERSGARRVAGATVAEARRSGDGFALLADGGGTALTVSARRLVLATGARELFLPFPGWTLPGVLGAGGAQALAKCGASLAGRVAVVAGSGPLLLAVAAHLARAGAEVALVAEQASFGALAGFGAALAGAPAKLLEAVAYRAAFREAPYRTGAWVAEARGRDRLESVIVEDGADRREIACDVAAVAHGLVPNTELARLLGCAVEDGAVRVDARQETTVPGVHAAGEACGVAGIDVALAEGEIAGLARGGTRRCGGAGRRPRARPGPRDRPAHGAGVSSARGAAAAPASGHRRLPLRGRAPRVDRRVRPGAGSQARRPRRHGPVSGPRVRSGARVSLRVGFRYGTPARAAGAPRPSRAGGDDMKWEGVFPAVTTPFREDLSLDLDFLPRHLEAMLAAGCRGFVPLGSLGESATLSFEEKERVLAACRAALGNRAALVAGVAALSTAEAVATARLARERGCDGLMVLPPYVYRPDRRETLAHFDAVLGATELPCMLYNNPIAYGTDVLPEDVALLAARHRNLEAVKESSADVRRVTAIRGALGGRIAVFVGVDDLIVEGIAAGAVGWIAGLVNALPRESVRLFDLAAAGRDEEARALYEWFLPLLRLDVVPKFVQLIKLVQQECGMGSERLRPPRLVLEGAERGEALAVIRERLARRPGV